MGTAESKLPEPQPSLARKGGRSARVSLEYIEADVRVTLDQLIPQGLPSLWQHQWVKSYHDDHLLYCSIWDSRHPGKRKGVVVFLHGFGLHSHAYDIPFLKVLAKNDYVAFSFDRRGHGRTGKAPGASTPFGDIGEVFFILKKMLLLLIVFRLRVKSSNPLPPTFVCRPRLFLFVV